MLMATQNAVGLKDISVSKRAGERSRRGQLEIMINLDEAAKHLLLCRCLWDRGNFRLEPD